MNDIPSHYERVSSMTQLHGKKFERAMAFAHRKTATSLVSGRNIVAGYARGWGLHFGKLGDVLQKDPLYQEALYLVEELRCLNDYPLMNLFLILKYGMKYLKGDIVDVKNNGAIALFIAYVGRKLGFQGTVYSLEIFQEIPDLEAYQKKLGLTNLVFVKGPFVDTAPHVLKHAKPIILAHLDSSTYAPLKNAISILKPAMHPLGGYFIFKDALRPQSLIAFQAVEEFVEEEQVYAEQNSPHLVYRFPHLQLPRSLKRSKKIKGGYYTPHD